MMQEVHNQGSDDQHLGTSLGIVSTINNLMTSSVLTANLAISYAKQGFKVLLLDLDLSHPTLSLLFGEKSFFRFTTNNIFEGKSISESIDKEAFTQVFHSNGLLTIVPASFEIKARQKIAEFTSDHLKNSLIKLLNFIKMCKQKYNFIIINMPSNSDLKRLTEACLVSDQNLLLIDQNSISISYGIDLVANLESIHPLIEFKGLLLYNYKYNVNFIDDERPLIEQMFNLPIIATLPEIPDQKIEQDIFTNDFKSNTYFKILSQELFKFIHEPKNIRLDQQRDIIEVLIIANKAGIPLFTSYLKGSGAEKSTIISQDEILASATLTAIVTGITEMMKEISRDLSGETKLIKQKHLSLVIEYDSPIRALMLTQRNEDVVRSKIVMFLKLFKQRFKDDIDSFIGVSRSFKQAQTLVEEVF